MPSEKINDTVSQGWYTEVRWRRMPDGDDRGTAEGHVQLATVNLHSPFEFPDVETDGHFEAGERFDGWRVTLDEAGIDRLIRTLHKAKRQAFPPSTPTQWAGPDISATLTELLAEVDKASASVPPEPPDTWSPSTRHTYPVPPPTLDGVDTGTSGFASGSLIQGPGDGGDSLPAFLSEGSGPYSHDPYTGRPAPTMPTHGYHLQAEADELADPESSTT